MAVSVAVAVGNIADKIVENIKINAEKLVVAPLTDKNSDMGPVISKEHKGKIIEYMSRESEGASLVLDGRDLNTSYENGFSWTYII